MKVIRTIGALLLVTATTFADMVTKAGVKILAVGADQNGVGWLKVDPSGGFLRPNSTTGQPLRADRCGEGYIFTTSNQILSTLLSAQAQGKDIYFLRIEDGHSCMGGAPMSMTAQGCSTAGTSTCRIEYLEVQ